MVGYADVYVLPVPKSRLDDYRALAELAGKVWREHGALDYVEVIADDVKSGVSTSFPQSVKLEDGEVVIVGWIVFRSRDDRDRVNAAVMKDERMKPPSPTAMPFDGKRMFWGGFDTLVTTAVPKTTTKKRSKKGEA